MKTTVKNSFTEAAVAVLKAVPRGRIATYGQVAALAGNPQGARQVVRILNSQSRQHRPPWHRIVNRLGRIALPPGGGFELQVSLLKREGVTVAPNGQVDLARYLWRPRAGRRA